MGTRCSCFPVQRWKKKASLKTLGLTLRIDAWLLFALFFPILVTLVAWSISFLWPGVSFSSDVSKLRPFVQLAQTQPEVAHLATERLQTLGGTWGLLLISVLAAIAFGPTVNAAIALGEELGWRGFLFVAWRPLGFWHSSYLIGLVWGLWHAPLIWHGHNYPQHPRIGVVLMMVFTTLWAPFFTLVRERSGSVWHAAVLHGTLNAIAGISLFTVGGNDLNTGITGLPGILTLLLANFLLWLYQRHSRSATALLEKSRNKLREQDNQDKPH